VPARVLILTASVGEGHDLPARTLAAQLRAESRDVEVVTEDGLEPMGRVVTAVSADAGRVVFFRFQWLWDVGFCVFAGFGPTRRLSQALLARVGGDGMAAADVLIHPTGGLTVLEAIMCGLPPISYGWGRGHIRANNAAFVRFGLADVVSRRDNLQPAIRRALARGKTPTPAFRKLPTAASFVLAALPAPRADADVR